MNDHIELRLTPHEYAYAHLMTQWLLPLKNPRAWFFVLAAILVGLWMQGAVEGAPSYKTYAIAAVILIPAWLLKEYLFVYNYFRKTSLPSCQIDLREEGLHYRYSDFDHVYTWSEIRSLTSTGTLLFLKLGGRRSLLLTRRGFVSSEHFLDWQQRIRQRLAVPTKV